MEKQKKELSLKTKILLLCLCPVLVISLSIAAVYITVNTVVDGEQYDFSEKTDVVPEIPEGDKAVSDAIISAMKAADAANDVRAEQSIDVSVSDINGSLTDSQKGVLSFLSSDIAGALRGMYETKNTEYGEDASFATFPEFDGVECTSELSEDGRTVKLASFADVGSKTAEYFLEKDIAVCEKAMGASTDECEISSVDSELTELYIEAQISAADGRMSYVSAQRKYSVTCNVVFSGSLAGLGEQEITFTYTVKDRFSFSYAGIFINEDNISIEHNGYRTLGISANVAETAGEGDFEITFTSSDPSVAKVDPNGMVEAVSESAEGVTVTVLLKYLGNTYTDSCVVFVGTPAEGVSVSPSRKTAAVGEKFSFEAKVKPSDATVRDVMWLSENESVCAVDKETGECTAVAPGETRIIAVTVDGYYMSASEITVEGGNANG